MSRKLHFATPLNVLICTRGISKLFHRYSMCRRPTVSKPSELVIKIIDGRMCHR